MTCCHSRAYSFVLCSLYKASLLIQAPNIGDNYSGIKSLLWFVSAETSFFCGGILIELLVYKYESFEDPTYFRGCFMTECEKPTTRYGTLTAESISLLDTFSRSRAQCQEDIDSETTLECIRRP